MAGLVVNIGSLAGGALGLTLLFGLMMREVALRAPMAFEPQGVHDRVSCLAFALDNLLEATLLDAPAIYDFHIASIRPRSLGTRSMVFMFRVVTDFLLLAAIWGYIRETSALRVWERALHASQRKKQANAKPDDG